MEANLDETYQQNKKQMLQELISTQALPYEIDI